MDLVLHLKMILFKAILFRNYFFSLVSIMVKRHDKGKGLAKKAQPHEVTQTLQKREPLLELPIEAMRKLVNRDSHTSQWAQDIPSEARALFFLGALAAGIGIPEITGDKPAKYAVEITL